MSGMQGENADFDNQQPTLCENGCGFFANPACSGKCSKCYRDIELAKERTDAASSKLMQTIIAPKLSEQPAPTQASQSPPEEPPSGLQTSIQAQTQWEPEPQKESVESLARKEAEKSAGTSSASEEAQPVEIQDIQTPKRPQDPKRCYHEGCGKKINPILSEALKCKCGYKFCNAHRLPGDHDCPVDRKEKGRREIEKNNPLVQAARFNRMN